MHLLFGGITDRIEKRHTETGVGDDAKSRGVYAVAVTAAKRTSPSRKLRQEAEIGSTSVFQETWSQIELFSSSKKGTLFCCSDFSYCVDFYEFVSQKSGCKWGNVNDMVLIV